MGLYILLWAWYGKLLWQRDQLLVDIDKYVRKVVFYLWLGKCTWKSVHASFRNNACLQVIHSDTYWENTAYCKH